MAVNPLLSASALPYQLPPFAEIRFEHYRPAFDQGLAEQQADVEAIATDPEPATFDNTIAALERTGRLLRRTAAVFFTIAGSDTTPDVQQLQEEIAPRLAAQADMVHLDPRLFARVGELYERIDELDLDPESAWLLRRYHTEFVRAGAELGEAEQLRLRSLNEELARLGTEFGNRLRADTNELAVSATEEELAGLPADAVSAAAEAARARGTDGYVLTLGLPTDQPALANLNDRGLRERLYTASEARGARGGEYDTTDLARRIAVLRAERAGLFGYPHHAGYVIADNTAGSADAAIDMLTRLVPAAVANAAAERADLQRAMAEDGVDDELRPWDWSYYAERVRRTDYAVDAAALRPYFELRRVLHDGVFHAASALYGITVTERPDLVGYHPDVVIYEMTDEDGSPLGLYLGDFYARDTKRAGAWMHHLVFQSHLLDERSVVCNNLNLAKPAPGEPTLLTFDEVRTLFHEFGHALHGLFSDVRHPSLSGTCVPRDFVEFPSQVNEMWALWPEVLATYARHHETGEPLPQEVVDRLLAARRFNEGFATTEYLAAALLDLAWHTLPADSAADGGPADVAAFEAAALTEAGVAVDAIAPRYRSSYFAHVFSGRYSAGYYSYIWSEVLDADTVEWFTDNGGLTRANGDHFRRELLSRGYQTDCMAAYRAFRGRDPELKPLLVRRGLGG